MAGLKYSLWLAVVAFAAMASGQEPVLTGPPLPPPSAAEPPPSPAESPLHDWHPEASYCNSYPMYRCEDATCCSQWWCETWYGRVELLTLARNYNAQQQTIIQDGTATPPLTANDIGFGLAPGVSTLLGHRLDGQTAVELVYFGANQWTYEQAVAGTANLRLPGALGLLDDFNNANGMQFTLRSTLHNAEVNYYHDLQNISVLAGFRFVNWQEQMQIHSRDSDTTESDYASNLSNNLLGGQIGARMARYHFGLDMELTGKAGLFGNRATQAQGITNNDGATIVRNVTATNNDVAFVTDVNFSAACPLTKHLRLRGGYNVMYVTGIALATNQLDFTNQTFSGRRVRTDGDVFLHGFNIGLEGVW